MLNNSVPVIAVGALGGSGTRVVAQILIDAGLWLGDDLNESLDNLTFTRLLKRPKWYQQADANAIEQRLRLFWRIMAGNRLAFGELWQGVMLSQHPDAAHSLRWCLRLGAQWLGSSNLYPRWGWKEPNTHIYLDALLHHFPNLRYIHLIRHGVDMAFSSNRQQLINWGNRFGIELTGQESNQELASKQLDYWIASNKRVVQLAEQFPQQVLLLTHQQLCCNPLQSINALLDFCQLSPEPALREQLYQLPNPKAADKRYCAEDLRLFLASQLAQVAEFGFEIG
ncbi:hypothetical protein D5085_11035 [Ectothiorhodospiraceae bacterium BW-2]|nr:hypothetical protein D5085_11035 [Ectothiorhodospiraceae bacterium BW-2]